jgi:phosphate starvation-inducible PhoH-like protein
MEHLFSIEETDLTSFYGQNDSNVKLIQDLFPQLKIVARGNVVKVSGDAERVARFSDKIKHLIEYCNTYNKLPEQAIRDIVAGDNVISGLPENTIIFGVNGRPIIAKTPNQRVLVKAYNKNDLMFACGPAGTGKTYTAIALAVKALKNREVSRIILSRPAVEAGESLGFLPGDMKDKIDPYLQPLYDALRDMIPQHRLREYMEDEVIHIAPLAYMRGRTLNNAIVILDEAQNTTMSQLKMFLTRMGKNAKFIITGDMTQIDLPHKVKSGLGHAIGLLKDIQGISVVEFDGRDIIRHPLVQDIVKAYEKEENK